MLPCLLLLPVCPPPAADTPRVLVQVIYAPPPGTDASDTVYYSPARPLRWSDFKGRVRSESPSAALSFTGFSYDAVTRRRADTVLVRVYLQVYFDKAGSWVRPGEASAHALAHEQLHFEIAALEAARFRKALLDSALSPTYYEYEINQLFLDHWRAMSRLQERFDAETGHGRSAAAQARWADQLRRARQALEDSP